MEMFSQHHIRSMVLLLAVCLATGGCSYAGSSNEEDPSSKAMTGETLWKKLVEFETALEQPLLDPFYAGISFEGNAPSSNNLVIFVLGEKKENEVRSTLNLVFDRTVAESIEIEIWASSETVASEKLKGELPVFETAGSTTSLSYDERIDRLNLGIRDLNDVSKLEEMLKREDVPREAVAIFPREYVKEE